MRKLFTLLFVAVSAISFSQNKISISGKILEKGPNVPLESATIYFAKVSDSTVVDYTISSSNGDFKFEIPALKYPVELKISYAGFKEYKKRFNELLESTNLGTIHLEENVASLNEVVVKGEAPPITIKSDTLEFNASSFKVRPDANVEALLKQLPGVEIDEEGKITVNGKEVNQVLVNGKPFFDKDGKIALQNLPSDIINKVQVSDTKTKKEEQTGAAASSNNASINLTIDEDKNKGLFGKAMAGYGSDDRYESSLLLNYFKNKRKFSVLASSNNINSTGFSMDEIFDNMGGGRSRSIWVGDNGAFGINGRSFGGNNGITQTNLMGLNYSDEWVKDSEQSMSYFLSNSSTENTNRRDQTSFLPDGDFRTTSQAVTKTDNTVHDFSTDFEFKIDSTTTINFAPSFNSVKTVFKNNSSQLSYDENEDLLNENSSDDYTENISNSFKNNLTVTKRFKRNSHFVSFEFNNQNSKNTDDDFTNSSTIFYQSGDPDDIRNQYNNTKNKTNRYDAELSFSKPITDSMQIVLSAYYEYENFDKSRLSLDYDDLANDYTIVNDNLTNHFESSQKTFNPKAGVNVFKKKYNFNATLGTSVISFNGSADYLGVNTNVKKNYILPSARMYANYKFSKTQNIWVSYSFNNNLPTVNQIIPIEDLANPLNTFIGNQDLGLNKYHEGYFSFRDYDYSTRSGYGFYSGGSIYEQQVISAVSFDENRKRTTTYENTSGTYNGWAGFYYNKTFKKDEHKLRLSLRFNSDFSKSKGITDDIEYEANRLQFSPRISLNYDYGELFNINPSYRVNLNTTNYKNYIIDNAKNTVHRFNIQTTNYWPKNWVFGNDFGYTYNSNISDGFKKDFYLWNTSLSYSFFDKMFTAKVKVYDILNQNQSNTRNITATTIIDEENIVLKRYVMFSLTYKLTKFGGKETKRNRFWFD